MAKTTEHLKPTKQQLERLLRNGYNGPMPQTRAEYKALWEYVEPPNSNSIQALRELGYNGPIPKTRIEAERIILDLNCGQKY